MIAQPSRRFKLTIGTDDLRFNYSVQVDTLFLGGRPVLNMIDMATHFCATSFLKKKSTAEIWRTIQNHLFITYNGPPDFFTVEEELAYISNEMRTSLESNGVQFR